MAQPLRKLVVGTDLANALLPSKLSFEYYFENADWQLNTHFDFDKVEATDISKVIDSFSIRKATGPDRIPIILSLFLFISQI